MPRRKTLLFFLTLFCILALAVPFSPSKTQAQADNVDVYGRTLPKDAAPYHQQIWQQLCDSTAKETSMVSPVTVYARICGADLADKFSDSLVVLDENLNIIPAAADKWEPSADGLTWTFHTTRQSPRMTMLPVINSWQTPRMPMTLPGCGKV